MENATKALIIAASVLIAIVLVALGVLLIGNVSDPSEQSGKVGNAIGQATGGAASDAIAEIKGESKPQDEFNKFRNDIDNNPDCKISAWGGIDIINNRNASLEDGKKITLIGYLYNGDADGNLSSKVSPNVGENSDVLIKFDNADDESAVKSQLPGKISSLKLSTGLNNINTANQRTVWRYGYNNGYITVVEYIIGFDLY